MNNNQKRCLIAVGFVMILMLLSPPFHLEIPGGASRYHSYGFLFTPPLEGTVVNLGLLLTQWVIVGSVGFIAWVLLKRK